MNGPRFISKKAPGDRHLSADEVERICSLIRESEREGKTAPLSPARLREAAAILREREPPAILGLLRAAPAQRVAARVARILERREAAVVTVDLGERTGFPRENARPVCEVLLMEREGALLVPPKPAELKEAGRPVIFLPRAFTERAQGRPHLLLQALLHPLLEWTFGLPHLVAVLCEAAYNAEPPPAGEEAVSDLNKFIAEEAGRDRDFAYFDRILGTPYEPDEFRMEELRTHLRDDAERVADVVRRARAAGEKFRGLVARILDSVRAEKAREEIGRARAALDDGDADQALAVLRRIRLPEAGSEDLKEEIGALVELAVRSFALDADPAYEGLRLEKGSILADPAAGRKARDFAALLEAAARLVREKWAGYEGEVGEADPLGERGAPRLIHVVADLERPSAKFVDGHDRAHWVFERSFAEALLSGHAAGRFPEGLAALLACRFVRDGAFPDEKLKMDRQLAVAVKGAIEGYRFFQSLSAETRAQMDEFVETSGVGDPLYRLFQALGAETHPSRAGRMIRAVVGRTHSFNYVRYPDTSLAGRVVVVTGGGTGMGRALALEAALRGANVVITGRRPGPLEETRQDMTALIRYMGLSNAAVAVQGDVSDPKYVGEMFDRIEAEFGRIDILYNNAGVSGPVEFGSVYREEHFELFREAVSIHLTGSYLASLEAARIMERQRGGGTIVMIGTFYSESIHRHVLHAYPGRLPYTCAQAAKLALGDYLAWALAGKNVTVLSLNPAAVMTERIRRGEGVFEKGARARARIGRNVSPESLEKDTLDRTVGREFVRPRDFARVALAVQAPSFRRTVGGERIPLGGVLYEQPPGVLPSFARLERYPDLVGRVALAAAGSLLVSDWPLFSAAVTALARSGANVVMAGSQVEEMERIAASVNSRGGEGTATVAAANLFDPSEVQGLFDNLPRIDYLLHFTGGVDWKRPLSALPHEEWSACVDRFGYVPRLLVWHAERRMDRDGNDGTIAIVGPDMSAVPSIRERTFVQVFQAMLRPAVATEAMERALMRKAQAQGSAPAHVSNVNIALLLPGRTDGRNRLASPEALAASVLWLAGDGKGVSGVVLLPDEQNSTARLPREVAPAPGTMAGKVAVVTGGIRNLGGAISLRLASEHATVVAASRRPRPGGSPEEQERAAAALREADVALAAMRAAGGRAIWVDTDVGNPRRVKALIDETRHRFGRIDAFVNNAGAGGDFSLVGDVLRAHRPSWEAVLRANFLGPWAAAACLAEIMGRQPAGGTIVNVSTHYADHPYLFRTIYTVSKILLKALTQALRDPLAESNVKIADVAPSLIAGPRMDWVMRNFAERFAAQFETLFDLPAAERRGLAETFLRSFDRTLSREDRAALSKAFLSRLRDCALPRAARAAMESWYARVGDWFRATVPDDPPANEEVAEAVVYAVKNGRFLESPFIGVCSLPPFASLPKEPLFSRKARVEGDSFFVLSAGESETGARTRQAVALTLTKAKAAVTAIFESSARAGRAAIARPLPPGAGTRRERAAEPLERDIDLSDPRVLESWLDSAVSFLPPAAGAVVFVGPTADRKPLLARTFEEMEGFAGHTGKALNLVGEAMRAVRPGGHVIVVAPPPAGGESVLLRAALRQIVRTSLAEIRFLPSQKAAVLSLLTAPGPGKEEEFAQRVVEMLAGRAPSEVEPIPVGPPRP